MHIYCKKYNKHTGYIPNIYPKKIILISKDKIKGKSICAVCLTERAFIDEIEGKYILESELEIYLKFFTDCVIKMKTYCVNCRTNTENIDLKFLEQKITN